MTSDKNFFCYGGRTACHLRAVHVVLRSSVEHSHVFLIGFEGFISQHSGRVSGAVGRASRSLSLRRYKDTTFSGKHLKTHVHNLQKSVNKTTSSCKKSLITHKHRASRDICLMGVSPNLLRCYNVTVPGMVYQMSNLTFIFIYIYKYI